VALTLAAQPRPHALEVFWFIIIASFGAGYSCSRDVDSDRHPLGDPWAERPRPPVLITRSPGVGTGNEVGCIVAGGATFRRLP